MTRSVRLKHETKNINNTITRAKSKPKITTNKKHERNKERKTTRHTTTHKNMNKTTKKNNKIIEEYRTL